MIWQEYFALNRIIILAVYGQVFFVLGLAIFLQSRRHSRLKLARDLRWLALFGILHGLHEWGLVFIPIQAEYVPAVIITALLIAQAWLLAASFACLLAFGVVLLGTDHRVYRWLAILLVATWCIISAVSYLLAPEFSAWVWLSNTWARYLLGLPGAILAGIGLYRQSQTELVSRNDRRFRHMLRLAAYSLFAYAVVAGLLVAPGPFFPVHILNQTALESWFGIPVEVFRSLAGLVLTISIIRALELFEVEVDHLIESMEVEAIQATERDRIGQEIHDGAMQGMYSVGLILNSMQKHLESQPARQRLAQAQQVLEGVILDLRRYMTSLRSRPPDQSLADLLADLVVEPRFRSLLDVDLDIADCPPVDAERTGHVLGLVQEALSNVVRHASATKATIRMVHKDGQFVLEIHDDGQGFDARQTLSGYGMQAMRAHARMIDAAMTVNSVPGRGTTVTVTSRDKGIP